MRKVITTVSIVFILVFLITNNSAAIDTKDWEGILAIQFVKPKPEKDWLLKTTSFIVKDAFSGKDASYYEQFINDSGDMLTVPIESNWHDLTSFSATFIKRGQGDYIYAVIYAFKKEKMTLMDIISRYGTKLADIKTNEDLSKSITYIFTKKTDVPISENPLWPLQPINEDQTTIITFNSKDKVFVDTLTVSTSKK